MTYWIPGPPLLEDKKAIEEWHLYVPELIESGRSQAGGLNGIPAALDLLKNDKVGLAAHFLAMMIISAPPKHLQ